MAKGWVQTKEAKKRISETLKRKIASGEIKRPGPEKGVNHPNWNGGKMITVFGYVLVKKPSHPFANNNGYVLEHRIVMEKHIGRFLKEEEHVHHLDFNKQNNKIGNLHLFRNNADHGKYHKFLRDCVFEALGYEKDLVKIIKRMYYDEKKTLVQIGNFFGCSRVTISRLMKRNGLLKRSISEVLTGRDLTRKHKLKIKSSMIVYWNNIHK